MLIRRQQWAIAIASLITIVVVSGLWIANNLALRAELERARMASQIGPVGAAQMRARIFEFLAQPSPAARERWYESHRALGTLLAPALMDGTPGEPIIAGLRARHAELPALFEALAADRLREVAGSAPTPELLDAQRLASVHFMDVTQQVAGETLRLLDLSQARLEGLHADQERLIGGLILALALVIGLELFLVHRRILKPLQELHEGARAIETGHYEHRLGMDGKDEIAELGAQFDHMADALGETLQALHQQRSQLEVANRELESFSYSVSHDLRAPLRGIGGWAQALEEDHGGTLPAEAQEYLARIRGECARMNLLIEDLLQLARVTRGDPVFEWLELDLLAREVAERVRESWPGRDIEFAIAPGLRVWGDRSLLGIALANLFDNACKFTARVPRAHIELGLRELVDAPGGRSLQQYFVRDNGAGFDMKHAARLFVPFQRMHSQREFPGTGIGLAIVQRIIQRHGGTLEAEASPGEGACFRFTLPLLPGPPAPPPNGTPT
ncbi:MAG TPA: ATP-binding protein [Thauera sp.]|uniref:sensor histidine kinase n=1 Tax=Thauera sp. TaxID=1905334 RepID=UPI002C07E5A4|nr:ATP-binding protein [Thauera sp.]HPE04596.1 ATP-binding protein [Thauera sp.]HRV78097.1 ATP-binding protein [Thauera sp.]